MKEILQKMKGKKVRLTCLFSDKLIFYNGFVEDVGDNYVLLRDKFNCSVVISLDVVKKVELI